MGQWALHGASMQTDSRQLMLLPHQCVKADTNTLLLHCCQLLLLMYPSLGNCAAMAVYLLFLSLCP